MDTNKIKINIEQYINVYIYSGCRFKQYFIFIIGDHKNVFWLKHILKARVI